MFYSLILFFGIFQFLNPAPLSIEDHIRVDGIERSYLLDLPQEKGSQTPLLIALHGGLGSGKQAKNSYGLTETARQHGYAVVYPDGMPSRRVLKMRAWNAGGCCGGAAKNKIDDVKFISLLIDKLIANHGIDPDRVYVTGISNGAMLSYRLACEIPEKIRAIAPVAGFLQPVATCGSLVPIMHFHSELDKNVPIGGGKGAGLANFSYPKLSEVMNTWQAINQCEVSQKDTVKSEGYMLINWEGCSTEMSYYITEDGGHSWPGAQRKPRKRADAPSEALNANQLMFDFFERNTP